MINFNYLETNESFTRDFMPQSFVNESNASSTQIKLNFFQEQQNDSYKCVMTCEKTINTKSKHEYRVPSQDYLQYIPEYLKNTDDSPQRYPQQLLDALNNITLTEFTSPKSAITFIKDIFAQFKWPITISRSRNKKKYVIYELVCVLHGNNKSNNDQVLENLNKETNEEMNEEMNEETNEETNEDLKQKKKKKRNTRGRLFKCPAKIPVKILRTDQGSYRIIWMPNNGIGVHSHTVDAFDTNKQVPPSLYQQITAEAKKGIALAKLHQITNGYFVTANHFYYYAKVKPRYEEKHEEMSLFRHLKQKYSNFYFYVSQSKKEFLSWVIINQVIATSSICQNGFFVTDATACTNFQNLPIQVLLVADPEGGYQVVAFGMLSGGDDEAHIEFFAKINDITKISPYAIIVDRLPAQINAINFVWPQANIVFCRRHLLSSSHDQSKKNKNDLFFLMMQKYIKAFSISQTTFDDFISQQSDKIQSYMHKQLEAMRGSWDPFYLVQKGLLIIRTSNPAEGFFGNLKYALVFLPTSLEDLIEELLTLTFTRMANYKRKSGLTSPSTLKDLLTIQEFAQVHPDILPDPLTLTNALSSRGIHQFASEIRSKDASDFCDILNEDEPDQFLREIPISKMCTSCIARVYKSQPHYPCHHFISQCILSKTQITIDDFSVLYKKSEIDSKRYDSQLVEVSKIDNSLDDDDDDDNFTKIKTTINAFLLEASDDHIKHLFDLIQSHLNKYKGGKVARPRDNVYNQKSRKRSDYLKKQKKHKI